ncbi:MAG: tetratricopeptide repeat protein [Deltaproteobacteria bacterium]|nr:tetratricopeptide repeat protein [Deltaproteobacteria bacterium]
MDKGRKNTGRRGRLVILTIVLLSLASWGCATDQQVREERARALEELGISYVQKGELRSGLKHLLEAERLDPEDAEIKHEIALVYRGLRLYDLSIEYFKKALALRPRYSEAYNNLGTVYILTRQWDKALACFKRASSDVLYRTPHFAYRNMGLVYYNKGEFDKAIESYQQAISLAPQFSPTYLNLGYAYEAVHRYQDAVEAYKKAIQYASTNVAALYRLGKLLYRLNRPQEALEVFERFLDVAPDIPEKREVRGLVAELKYRTK